ncbi:MULTISPECIES: thiol reductant ABC exporter subunit CydD [Cysteiniphilum]|uniref:Thiol reductant ABC exporter subunit CydD n=1 Tax=Cysteiniphilum litorale TaxID=2056700 RepID=A0A8J2Z4B7_9GAMM|nr:MULTISPECIES: thiol reductant ABC exporter subunit CydD [Cysteiniphilum]GGF98279.1 thiol reductant ABC exporter subunit CydD [Cysteiniphilum litorale]
MQANTASERKSARIWLKSRAHPAKKWVQLTILVSFLSGLLLIGQLYLLAYICYAAYIEKLSNIELISYFVAIIAIVFMRAGLSWLKEVVSFKAAAKVKEQLRDDVIAHINQLGPVKSGELSSGDLISAAMEQVEGLNNFLMYFLPQMTLAGLMPLAILIFIFPQSIVCGIILLVCAPLIPLFMMLVGWGAESENQKHFQTLARMSSVFLDTLHGLATLRLFNRAESHAQKIFEYSDDYRVKTMKVLRIAFLSSAVLEVFSAASIALVAIYLGMGFINSANVDTVWWSFENMTLQGGLFILLLAPEFFLPLRELSTHYHAKTEAMGAALELQKIFALSKHDDAKGEKGEKDEKGEKINQVSLIQDLPMIDSIQFNHLSFCYANKSKNALTNICFEVKHKQKIAIVGASGAGKTTILNLLMQFMHAKDEAITINHNLPLNCIDERLWLSRISWLGQSAGLFKGSIRYNLQLADADAQDDALWHALKLAQLDQEVNTFPDKLATEIGEQSIGLSGGQAQRLALARAYLKPCELLLLDEPTASLDKESENLIMQSLLNNWQNKTVIMLTHRLQFLSEMDHIIVMAEGEIVQQGCLEELLQDQSSYFYALYRHQVLEGEVACAH